MDRDRKEKERMKLFWSLVIFSMLGVFCVWLEGVDSNLRKLGGLEMDMAGFPEMPEGASSWNLNNILGGIDELNIKYEEDFSSWQKAGDEYLDGKDIFGETGDFSFLRFIGADRKEDSIYLEYGHYYKDLPVLGSSLILVFDENSGEFLRFEDNLKKGIEIEIDPRISLKEAVLLAEKEIDEDGCIYADGNLAIAEYESNFYLVWDIIFAREEDETEYEVLIGAKNGGLVSIDKSDILEG